MYINRNKESEFKLDKNKAVSSSISKSNETISENSKNKLIMRLREYHSMSKSDSNYYESYSVKSNSQFTLIKSNETLDK